MLEYKPVSLSSITIATSDTSESEKPKLRIRSQSLGVDGKIEYDVCEPEACLREIFAIFKNDLEIVNELTENMEQISELLHRYYEQETLQNADK